MKTSVRTRTFSMPPVLFSKRVKSTAKISDGLVGYNHGQVPWDSTAFYLSNHFLSHILGSFASQSPSLMMPGGKKGK